MARKRTTKDLAIDQVLFDLRSRGMTSAAAAHAERGASLMFDLLNEAARKKQRAMQRRIKSLEDTLESVDRIVRDDGSG